jgi:hypothetical protein
LSDSRDLKAWNAESLDFRDGGAFVAAVMDRDGRRSVAIFAAASDIGAGPVARLDPVDVLQLVDALDQACQGHGGAPKRFSW